MPCLENRGRSPNQEQPQELLCISKQFGDEPSSAPAAVPSGRAYPSTSRQRNARRSPADPPARRRGCHSCGLTRAERSAPGPTICSGGGGGWIRTSVGEANGFTVRPL